MLELFGSGNLTLKLTDSGSLKLNVKQGEKLKNQGPSNEGVPVLSLLQSLITHIITEHQHFCGFPDKVGSRFSLKEYTHTYSCYCIFEQFPGLANSKFLGLAICLLMLVPPPFQQMLFVGWIIRYGFEPTSKQCLLHAQSTGWGICSWLLHKATTAVLGALDAHLATLSGVISEQAG